MPMVANAAFPKLSGCGAAFGPRQILRRRSGLVRVSARGVPSVPRCSEQASKFKRGLFGVVPSLKISASNATLCLPRNGATGRPDHRFVPGGS